MRPLENIVGRRGRVWGVPRRTLRTTILFAFVSLLITTVVIIAGYSYVANRNSVLEQSDLMLDLVSETVIEKVTNYLTPATRMVEMSSRLVEKDTLSLTRSGELEAFTIEVVRAYPQLAMFNVGDEHGNFLMPKKYADGRIDTKIIHRTADPPSVVWKRRNVAGRIIDVEETPDINYDPRTRPWYVGAKQKDGRFWTDIYILYTDQQPGVTASYPITDATGRVLGVFGLDIELGELSEFLQKLRVGQNGIVFIINAKSEVVAYPHPSQIVKREDGALRPVRIDELEADWITDASLLYQQHRESRFDYTSGDVRYRASFTPLPQHIGTDWTVVLLVPEDDFIGFLKRNNRTSLLMAVFILLFATVMARILARSISRPITVLAEQTEKIKEFRLDEPVGVESHILEIQRMSNSLSAMQGGLAAFHKYVPAALVRQLIQTGEEARLGGQTRELTIFFSDVEDFARISEETEPEALFIQLSEYFDRMTTIILTGRGTVDKFIGDCVMAFWGAPVRSDNHAVDACRAALRCQAMLRELNKTWHQQGKQPLVTRIGIHTGLAVVGNVGSTERMNYTVMGDSVNTASRLEGVNKFYGTRTIVSDSVYELTQDQFVFRPLDKIRTKGKSQAITIYELLGDRQEPLDDGLAERCAAFAQGFEAYQAQDWDKALEIFEQLADGPGSGVWGLATGRSTCTWNVASNIESNHPPPIGTALRGCNSSNSNGPADRRRVVARSEA